MHCEMDCRCSRKSSMSYWAVSRKDNFYLIYDGQGLILVVQGWRIIFHCRASKTSLFRQRKYVMNDMDDLMATITKEERACRKMTSFIPMPREGRLEHGRRHEH